MKLNELNKKITAAKLSAEELLYIKKEKRQAVLLELAKLIDKRAEIILQANKKDIISAKKNKKSENFIERLSLDEKKINSMVASVREVAKQRDVLFKNLESRKMPSGILIKKVCFPLGLIAMIYESRPNVTIDAFALAFKSGNSIILKGGREIYHTNQLLVSLIKEVLSRFYINKNVVQDISAIDERLTFELIRNKKIDCLIPRGGKGLINFINSHAQVPVIITGASVVHTYIDKSADLNLAKKVVINAKTRRTSICNALDVLLLHKKIYDKFLSSLINELVAKNVELRADKRSFIFLKKIGYSKLKQAHYKDFDTEFLDYILAIRVVNNFSEALAHIKQHSLGHSEAIVTKSKDQAENFFQQIDAACLYLNTSTQFSDGGEFGMGGEIGISTQKLHARGPFAYRELTTYKYIVSSNGGIRK
jgi:glutamate-5-semialdehyde dehydrogenase